MGQCHQPVSDQKPVVVTVSEVAPVDRVGKTSLLPSTNPVASPGSPEQSPEQILLCSPVSNLADKLGSPQPALLILHGFWPVHDLALLLDSSFTTFLRVFVFAALGVEPKPSHFFDAPGAFPH